MNTLLDMGINSLVKWLFPMPILGDILAGILCKYKWQILGITIIINLIPVIILIGSLSTIKSNTPAAGVPLFIAGGSGIPLEPGKLPESLKNYQEPLIRDSGTPNGNPLGGQGQSWVNTTCVYYCSGYTGIHYGIDFVPNYDYTQNSEAYKLTSLPIVFATCTGFATSGWEAGGAGNFVKIKCNSTQYTVIYMHFSDSFIPYLGVNITAGQPIGVVGSTGNSTGPHLHYQIKTCSFGGFNTCTVNPQNFIN